MFKALLQRWSVNGPARVTSRADPDHASSVRFDLRFQDGPHWELREQVNLVAQGTRPDFYATRWTRPARHQSLSTSMDGSFTATIPNRSTTTHNAVPQFDKAERVYGRSRGRT